MMAHLSHKLRVVLAPQNPLLNEDAFVAGPTQPEVPPFVDSFRGQGFPTVDAGLQVLEVCFEAELLDDRFSHQTLV